MYKDPQEVRDFEIDYYSSLQETNDTIHTSVWASSDSTLVIDSDTNTTTKTTVRLSEGTNGTSYTVTNTMVTIAGLTFERSLTIVIKDTTVTPLIVDEDNSYVTVDEAEIYFQSRLYSEAWEDATEPNKAKSVITATKMIERLNIVGIRTDVDQILLFPRDDDIYIPDDIQNATCEIALSLLDGIDPDMEYDNLSTLSEGYGNIRSTFDRSRLPEHVLAGIPSVRAWRFLRPYIRDVQRVDLHRLS